MILKSAKGQMCVGDWRLLPIDVGFDCRGMAVEPPREMRSAGYLDDEGRPVFAEGTREELIAAVRSAGYDVRA